MEVDLQRLAQSLTQEKPFVTVSFYTETFHHVRFEGSLECCILEAITCDWSYPTVIVLNDKDLPLIVWPAHKAGNLLQSEL